MNLPYDSLHKNAKGKARISSFKERKTASCPSIETTVPCVSLLLPKIIFA